LSVNYQAVSFT